MKRFSLLFSIFFVLLSCKKSSTLTGQPDSKLNVPKHANIQLRSSPTWNLLGYGYNVAGEYAKPTSARGRVLDIEALNNDHPSAVEDSPFFNDDYNAQIGSNSLDVSKGLTFNAGLDSVKFKLFKASFTASYKDSSYKSSKYIFAKFQKTITQRRLYLVSTLTLLQNYLDPNFASAIQSETPAYIVQNYGTHILADIILGGKLEAFYRAETSSSNRTKAAGGGLEISLKKFFGISAGYTQNTAEASSNYSQTLQYNALGGSGTIVSNIVTVDPNSTVIPMDITAWQNSITLSNSTLIDFNGNSNGAQPLIPIYDLIADPAKRSAVKTYVDQYLFDNRVKIDPEFVYENYAASIFDHVYSLNPSENLEYTGWVHHGSVFKAFASQMPGTVPIYESYNNSLSMHHYSTNKYATSGWAGYINNGVGWTKFYAYKTQVAGTVPVYQYHLPIKDYLYSTAGNLAYPGWRLEGVAFYTIP